jgi:hypothetical protein
MPRLMSALFDIGIGKTFRLALLFKDEAMV